MSAHPRQFPHETYSFPPPLLSNARGRCHSLRARCRSAAEPAGRRRRICICHRLRNQDRSIRVISKASAPTTKTPFTGAGPISSSKPTPTAECSKKCRWRIITAISASTPDAFMSPPTSASSIGPPAKPIRGSMSMMATHSPSSRSIVCQSWCMARAAWRGTTANSSSSAVCRLV
jgi:hypothetical protein